jgi:tetratricopeptide (TPR) repeat protein
VIRGLWLLLVVFSALLAAVAAVSGWRARSHARIVPTIDLAGLDPDVAAAISDARDSVVHDLQSAHAWGQYGHTLLAHESFAEAAVCYETAAELNSGEVRWWYLRGLCLERTNPETALLCFTAACGLGTGALEPHWKRAEVLLAIGRVNDAEHVYRAVYAGDPEHPRTLLGLARISFLRGQLEEALTWTQRAVRAAPQRRDARELLCQIHSRLGDQAAAAVQLEIMEALPKPRRGQEWDDPFMVEVARYKRGKEWIALLAQEWIAVGRPNRALELLGTLGAEQSPDVRVVLLVGKAHLHQRAFDKAERVLERAKELDDSMAPVHFELGNLALLRGRFAEAKVHYRAALARQPEFPAALVNLGQCLQRLGDREGAIRALREGCRQHPLNPRAQQELAALLKDAGREKEAAEHLAAAARFAEILAPSAP